MAILAGCCRRAFSSLPPGFSQLSLPFAREGERLDHAFNRLVLKQESAEPIPLSMLYKWARSGILRVQAAPPGTKIVGEKCLKHRLLLHDMVLIHESVRGDLKTISSSPHTVPHRSKPHESEPPWTRSCVRWASKDFVVVSKPSGVASQGGTGIAARSTLDYWLPHINERVNEQLPSCSSDDLKLVHRLDRDVSGLLVLARNRAAADAARHALTQRSGVTKFYVAFVDYPLAVSAERRASGILDSSITVAGKEQSMQTRYHAVPLEGTTILFLQPITGRKHQLRQHVVDLFTQRAAIYGDALYAPRQASPYPCNGRIYLHSLRVGLQLTGYPPAVITDDLPSDFQDLLAEHQFHRHQVLQHLEHFDAHSVLPYMQR